MRGGLRRAACIAALLALLQAACFAEIQIQDCFCRGGQVFLHWSDTDTPDHYHVYRSPQLIDSSTIDSAELICGNVPIHSARDKIADKITHPDPPIGVRITDLGPTLDPNDALWVHTVKQAGSYYYAVVPVDSDGVEDRTVEVGENSLAGPIAQSTGASVPVVDEQGQINNSGYIYAWKRYVLFRRDDECQREGEPTKFCVTFPANYSPTKRYITVLALHGYGGYYSTGTWWETIYVSPYDYAPFLPYSCHDWWYGYCDSYPIVSSGTVVNYTENMLLHMIDWLRANTGVDEDRVYLTGHSMGGTGSISFGLRHPEIFAGITVTCPQVNPGLPGAGFQGQLDDIWGAVSTNLPTNDGPGVWDRMNMTAFVNTHPEDLPFLKVMNSKNDFTLPWFQIPDFYKSLNASRHGFVAGWGQGGHTTSCSGLPSEFCDFNVYSKIRRNVSYVAVSNSSANKNPGNGNPSDGDSVGQMNAGYDWSILAGTSTEWSAAIRYTPGASVTADISARRLQQLHFAVGEELCYVLKSQTTAEVIRSGRVNAERANLFVIPQLPFDGANRVLTVYKSSPQRVGDLRNLGVGGQVDLNLLHVTAVFADRCYAQPDERTLGVAITGATGLTEGDLIDLKGTKADSPRECAVTAQVITVRGRAAVPGPLGLPKGPIPFYDGANSEGLLAKAWGKVTGPAADGFWIDAARGNVLIYGECGTAPQTGTLVLVTGISAVKQVGEDFVPGIRVRRVGDVAGP